MRWALLVWAYAVEVILVTLVIGLLLVTAGLDAMVYFTIGAAGTLGTILGLTFTGCLGFLWAFYQHNTGRFGDYLSFVKAQEVYAFAFITPIIVHAVSGAMLLVANHLRHPILLVIAFTLALYSYITFFTTVFNFAGFFRLRNEFRTQMLREGIDPGE